MRDVQLWWRLHDAPGPDLIEALAQLAELPLRDRAPFLGLVAPLLTHAEVGLRRAAVRVLAGARGIVGMRSLVDALDDDDASIRSAAVASLREVAKHEYARWAHVVFHPRQDVRAAALEGKVHTNCAHYGAYLRADPSNRERAEALPLPSPAIGLVLGLWRRNAISPDDAASNLSKARLRQLRDWLAGSRRRSATELRDSIEEGLTARSLPTIVGSDALDGWVEIIAAASPAAASAAINTMAEAVLSPKLLASRSRLTLAVLRLGIQSGFETIDESLLGLAAACEPKLLAMGACPIATRRRAAKGLLRYRERVGRSSPRLVDNLLHSELAQRPDGSPDLIAAIAIVGLLPRNRLAALIDRFGLSVLIAAIPHDLPGWSAICDLPVEPGHDSTRVLEAATTDETHAALTAIALGRYATHNSGALQRVVEAAAPIGPVLVEIVKQAQAGLISGTPEVVTGLAGKLVPRARIGELSAIFSGLIDRLAHEPSAAAVVMIGAVSSHCDSADCAVAIAALPQATIAALVAELGTTLHIHHLLEVALAETVLDSPTPAVRTWAEAALLKREATPASALASSKGRELSSTEKERITTSSPNDLNDALAPAVTRPSTGVVEALERRTMTGVSHMRVCVALIGCRDSPKRASALIDQWHADDEDFADTLACEVLRVWQGLPSASWLAQAWMHAFEKHAFSMLKRIDAYPGGLVGTLAMIDALPGAIARRQMWRAIASVITLRRYRDRVRLISTLTPKFDDLLVHILSQLDTDVGVSAAKLLVTLHLGGLNVSGARKRVLELAPDMDSETVYELSRFVGVDGLPTRTAAARRRDRMLDAKTIEGLRRASDLDELIELCRANHRKVVHLAATRLVGLGTLGERRLANLLKEIPYATTYTNIALTLTDWHDEQSLEVTRELARDASTPAHMRFRLAIALHVRGESGWMVAILRALRAPAKHSWFGRDEWAELVALYPVAPRGLALELADSPHPHVYRNAMQLLLSEPIDDDSQAAYRRFLEQGSLRPSDLRRATALRLNDYGDPLGLPVLMSAVTEPAKGWEEWLFTPPTQAWAGALGELLLASTLYGGPGACDEARLLSLVDKLKVPPTSLDEIRARLLTHARNPRICQQIVQTTTHGSDRRLKIHDIADTFAWGVRRGRELTGRFFRVHMTWQRGDYGHTYLDSNSIHVTPLPILRGDRYGRDVVEALILHEYGHHMYHRGEAKQRVWGRATGEGLGHLFNLVADEQLERNLRALRPEYGDRLKRLASYAFQHNDREMNFDSLLQMLGASAFDALSQEPLGLAFDARSVLVHSGNLLRELERVGNSFARFVRALRQGLGNRHGDPIVEEALDLFRHRFRHSTMNQLYATTKRLQELFGFEAKLAEQIGSQETIKESGREAAIHGENIDDAEVQREIERILDPRQLDRLRKGADDGSKPRKLAVNVIDDDSFTKITDIRIVAPDAIKHREIAAEVRRHSERIRRYFSEMGLSFVPQRARMRGRAFDKTRARAVVLRRDPRMLVARQLTVTTDLFIGVVIDCSGSMRTGESMKKAHRFGVLLAEAVRGLSNVDARFFGFTDDVIYDAGNERQCAVAALETGGGNNDAAALYHAAMTAERSRRRSKLLVMISDGLPTECSAVALRNLAEQITRRKGILCAQVAVRPLAEVCFPHYVEIKPGDTLDVAVRRFGEIVARLAKRALGR
ncbi:MAG: hypothetical protein JKY37_23585 [Nannocystaceae bacterium]|nr:hypothetical protein [Nannocystaceae bacterium]